MGWEEEEKEKVRPLLTDGTEVVVFCFLLSLGISAWRRVQQLGPRAASHLRASGNRELRHDVPGPVGE